MIIYLWYLALSWATKSSYISYLLKNLENYICLQESAFLMLYLYTLSNLMNHITELQASKCNI